MKRLLLILPTLALLRALQAAPSPNLENTPHRFEVTAMHGRAAPALDLSGWINSAPLPLTELRGKIVVLDFWATHCRACLSSVPSKNELSQRLKDQGVVIIGVCLRDGGERMQQMVEKHGILYPVALDAKGWTARRFHVDSYPDYYVIDREGRLRWGDIDNRDLEKAVRILLDEPN